MRRRSNSRSSSRPALATLAAAALLAATLCLPSQASAQEAGAGADGAAGAGFARATWDLLILRPLGLARLGIGTVYLVPAVVMSAPGGLDNIEEAWDHFVATPGQSVFERPLGDL